MKKIIIGTIFLLVGAYFIHSMFFKYIDDYTPEELYSVFNNDEIQALIDYQNKDFMFNEVEVLTYEKSVLKEGKYSVAIHGEDYFYSTMLCYLDVSELREVQIGSIVDISGTLTTYDALERIIFENCKIHTVYPQN